MITQQQQVLKEVKKEAARAEILDDLSPSSTLLRPAPPSADVQNRINKCGHK